MSDEYNEFDDGFDNDLDDMIDNMDTEPSLAKKPTTKREVVVNTLEDASKGFIDEYKDDPINAVGDILKKSIPSEISEEVGGILNVKDSLKDEYKDVVKDVKKNARSTFNIVKKVLPKNKITDKIVGKLDNILGNEEETSKGPSKEELEQQAIQANIANAIGAQDKLDSTESLFKQTLEYNRFKTTEELNNISASRLTEISNFNRNITYKYFAKSLELQYKSIYISKEQLDVIKTMGDTFKNQFESIVKNTSLPDIIKVRSSEAIKHQLKAKATNDLTDTLFKEKGVFGNVTDKIKTIGGNVKTKINEALNTTSDLAEQKAMMDEMDMPGMSKGTMAGSFLADYVNTLVGKELSRKIANNDTAKKGMYTLKNVLADPSAYINKAASKVGYGGLLRSKAALGLNTVSDILNTNEKMTNISVGKDDLDNAKLFDGRAYSSITKVIPGLLSKIYSELKSTRLRDNKPDDHELTYDFEKSTFNRKKDTVKELKHKVSTRIENTAAVGLDTLISYMQEYGGLKITNKKELDSIRKALTAYVISGKPLVPELMVDYGFLDYFKGKSKKKMSTVMDNLRIGLKDNIYANEYFIKGLKQYKNSLPKIEKDVESIAEAGNIKLLKDAGIMTYDEVYGTYNTSEETLSKLYLDSVGGLDTNGFKFDKSKVKKQKEKKTTSTGIKSKLNNVKKDISNKAEVVKKQANDTLGQVKNSDTVKQATDTIDKVNKNGTVKQAKKILTDTNIKDVIDEVKEEANKKASKTTNQVKKQATDTIDKVNKNETVVEAKKQASNTLDKVKKSDTVKQAKKILSDTNVKDIVDEVKEEVKKDLEGTTLDTIKEKVATNIDKAKELAKNSTETVKSKIEKTYEEINTPELTEEQEEALKEDFLNSKAFKEGKVTSFRTYLKSLGFGKFDGKKFLNNLVVKFKEYAHKAKQFLTDRLNPFLKTITAEEEEALKKEYENSEAIKNGVTFSQYMKAFGFKPKLNLKANIRALLKKTRALDRKIASAVVKSPVTLAKKLFSKKDNTKEGSSLAGRVVKGTLKGAGTAIGLGAESFAKGITGYDVWGPKKDDKDKSVLDKTRGLDRSAAKAILMTPKTISNLIKTTTTSIIDKINKSKEKKVNKFDTDGDGKREGNWKDRLKGLIGSKKDKKDPRKRGILNFVKNNKGLSTTAILTGVLLAMKSMGITMDDVIDVGKGIWSGIKDIGNFLSPIFGFLKKTFTKIGDVMSGIAGFFGIKSSDNKDTDKESSDAESIGKGVAYGVGGLVAYKGGKAVYKTGKAVYKTGKVAYKTGKVAYKGGKAIYKGGKAIYKTGKAVSSAAKTTENVASKVAKTTKAVPKSKSFIKKLAGRVSGYLSKFKRLIVKRYGPKLASKLLAKIAARFVGFLSLGWALLLYDAGMIAYDMYHNGTEFKVAVSKQVLGFNIFGDEVPTDENGKPLEDKGLEQKALAKVKDTNVPGENKTEHKFDIGNNSNDNINTSNNNIKKHAAANKASYKKNISINSKIKTIGDGENKVSDVAANNKAYKPTKDVNVRGGKLYNPDGGENNITLAKGVTIDGLNPAMDKKLKAMANEYNEITGKKILVNSGYRSTADQVKLRKKYGVRAARPGHSTHEFGLAVDINGSTLDELDKLGLMGKYKLTRPVGKEKWHVEPAGIQLDIKNAKKDPDYAAKLIDNVPKGGAGWGLVGDARKYSRNEKYQEELIKSKSFKMIDPNTGKPSLKLDTPKPNEPKTNIAKAIVNKDTTLNPASKDNSIATSTKSVTNTKLAQAKDNMSNKKMDSFVKPMRDNVSIAKESNSHLNKISTGIGDSVELQRRMLSKLDEISKSVISKKDNEEEKNTAVNNVKRLAPDRERSSLPEPAVSLARATY